MSFVVTKSSPPVLIGPSEPTPAGNLPLTSTDKSRLCNSLTSLQVFDHPIHEPAETVRRALFRALVHYHPIAGRLAVGANSDVHLACTGEGVAFVAATANCSLEDARFLHAPLAIPLADLVVRYGGRCPLSDPLLMVQVTEFSCGEYGVAVTFNHGVADVSGVAQFLQVVGELARGVFPPSVIPVRYDESLPEIPQLFTALAPRLTGREHIDFAYTDMTIPWSYINRVKAEFVQQDNGGQRSCSTFDMVSATMWQCRTRATTKSGVDNPGTPAPLVFVANVRSHVGAKEGYYGNCITSQVVTAATGTVANGDTVELVKLVRRGKEQIPSIIEVGELPVQDEELMGALCGYGVLTLTSSSGIVLDVVDFGGGKPARVIGNKEMPVLPTCIACPPCSRKGGGGSHGVNVIVLCVREEHADGFHAELAMLR